jgi:hypothetical protein
VQVYPNYLVGQTAQEKRQSSSAGAQIKDTFALQRRHLLESGEQIPLSILRGNHAVIIGGPVGVDVAKVIHYLLILVNYSIL